LQTGDDSKRSSPVFNELPPPDLFYPIKRTGAYEQVKTRYNTPCEYVDTGGIEVWEKRNPTAKVLLSNGKMDGTWPGTLWGTNDVPSMVLPLKKSGYS